MEKTVGRASLVGKPRTSVLTVLTWEGPLDFQVEMLSGPEINDGDINLGTTGAEIVVEIIQRNDST